MKHDEQGSTLLTVLAAVTVLTVMMTGLYTVSNRSLTETMQYDDGTRALTNARSGIVAVYQAMQAQWQLEVSSGQCSDIKGAKDALSCLPGKIDEFVGAPFSVSVTAPDDVLHNDFQQVDQSTQTELVTNLYQNYPVQVTGNFNGVTRTLYATFQISGTVDALNYSVYTPGNLILCGAPEIDGSVSAGQGVYVDTHSWSGPILDGITTWYRENDNMEPDVLPKFGSGSSLLNNGLRSFSSFNYSDGPISDTDFLSADNITDSQPIPIPVQSDTENALSTYISGSPTLGKPKSLLQSDYVKQAIDNVDSIYKSEAQQQPFNEESFFPDTGGYIDLTGRHKGTFDYSWDQTLTGDRPLYIDGNLTIESGAHLTLSQPLFVSGNLVINGYLNSSSAIFVRGTTTIVNVPTDTGQSTGEGDDWPGDGGWFGGWFGDNHNGNGNGYGYGHGHGDGNGTGNNVGYRRLLITSGDSIYVQMATGEPSNSPATFDAFLISGSNLRLIGMAGYYRIIGGVAAQNIELDSTVGKDQYVDDKYLYSNNWSDLTRRLQIIYDASYANWPMNGTPTVSNLVLQPMPQPTTTKPAS